MDYNKLADDLLFGCEENCADCEYAGDIEYECSISQLAAKAITELLTRAEAAEDRAEKAESKLKSAVSDMNGICYLCGNGKPYLLGNATLRICDHYPGAASNKRPSCQYFTWKGMEE